MDDTNTTNTPELSASSASTAAPVTLMTRSSGVILLLALLATILSAYTLWHSYRLEQQLRQHDLTVDFDRIKTDVIALQRDVEQKRHEVDKIGTRLTDHENVNKSLREEVLGITERTRLLEDALANLAEKRQSGHDAILLNDAELLLLFAQQRYTLFQDSASTINAYRMVDGLLAEMDDPTFASVRQTLSAEIEALTSTEVNYINEILKELARIREGIDRFPLASSKNASDASTAEQTSRLEKFFHQFVRITHNTDTTALLLERDTTLAQQLIKLDLREAEAALLMHDNQRYQQTMKRVRTACAERFDASAPSVAQALATLDRLAMLSLTTQSPAILGATLKELRNLRSLHKLQNNKNILAPTNEISS